MILADKIISERKKNGWSQEDLADKLNVSRQSVSKWESAQSTPDINRILQMAEIFNVSTDYLLKDDIDASDVSEHIVSSTDSLLYKLTMSEANDFINLKATAGKKIALGVSFCIISPALLMFLGALSEAGLFLSENIAGGIGLLVLFIFVIAAVAIFVMEGMKLDKYKHLYEEPFEAEYGIEGYIKELKDNYNQKFIYHITIGVALCIFACVPLMVAGMSDASDLVCTCLMALLLIIVAVAVNLFVSAGNIMESYKIVLQLEDYTIDSKLNKKKIAPLSGAFWSIVLAGYLLVSFLTNAWHITWVVWPVAAILFGAVTSISSLVKR